MHNKSKILFFRFTKTRCFGRSTISPEVERQKMVYSGNLCKQWWRFIWRFKWIGKTGKRLQKYKTELVGGEHRKKIPVYLNYNAMQETYFLLEEVWRCKRWCRFFSFYLLNANCVGSYIELPLLPGKEKENRHCQCFKSYFDWHITVKGINNNSTCKHAENRNILDTLTINKFVTKLAICLSALQKSTNSHLKFQKVVR